MKDGDKTKKQLLTELEELRTRVAELDKLEKDRKQMQESLRSTNELLENIFSTTHLAIAYMDRDFNFIRVNRAYAEADRRVPKFFVGKNHFDLYPNEENEAIFREVVETGEPHTAYAKPFNYPEQPERGETYWDWTLHPVKGASGEVEGVILALVDVTERIKGEQDLIRHHDRLEELVQERTAKLEELNEKLKDEIEERLLVQEVLTKSEQNLRAVLEASPLPIVAIDADGKVDMWNPAAERTFGWTEKEVKGRPYPIVPDYLVDEHLSFRMRAFQGESFTGIELVRQKKDGTLIDVSVSTAPIVDATGSTTSVMAVLEDITERRQAEEALSRHAAVNAIMAELTAALLSSTSIDDIAQLVLQYAKSLTGSEFGFVSYIDRETGYNVSTTLTRDIWDVCQVADKKSVFKKFTGLWGWVLKNKQPLLTNEPETDHRSTGTPEGHVPIYRFLSVPALIGDKLVGQIALANSPVDYTGENLSVIERLADLYAVGLQRKQAEEDLKEAYDKLEERVEERTAELRETNEQLRLEIEERMAAKEALQESEEKFRLVTETIQDVFWLSTPGIEEMIYVSPAYEKIWGRTRESLYKSAKSFMEPIHPEDREHVLNGVEGHAEGVWDFEYRIIRPDGSLRWIRDRGFPVLDERGKLIRMTGVATDVTEQKLAEEQIRQSKEMLQTVFDGISEPLIMLDKNLSALILNEAARAYYGIADYQAIIGKPCHEIFRKDPLQCEGCQVLDSITEGKRIVFERQGFRDSERLERVVAYPLHEEKVGVTGCIVQISDITEQKRAEKQLIRADRLSSLGQLSGGIAHEIRNPLSGISLFVDVLLDENQFHRTDEEMKVFQEIKHDINKINSIIRRVLDFARESDGLVTEVNLNSLIEENLKLWYAQMRKEEINLEMFLEKDLPVVIGDSIALQQVVNNLIQNAIEAMPGGGTLAISTKTGISSYYDERPVVIIEISDTGPGIPLELHDKIFNPFFTTKAVGTGLGLSISHQILEKHGGTITCESKPGQPTTFTVELPITPRDSE